MPQQRRLTRKFFSSDDLARRTVERRAVEAVIWGTPAVNFDVMYQAMVRDAKSGDGSNKIVYWSRLFDWKNQTLTPNPDSIYFMAFFNTQDVGPVVLEIPPADEGSITGSIDDCWQTAIEDVGPAGLDKGKGGKYLILPPGYKEQVPSGYIALQSYTYQGYALLRSILKSNSDAGVGNAVVYGQRIKLYPLSRAAHPTATQFVDAIDVVYDANIPWDLRFFESLHRMVQTEPWLERDKAMIDQLRSIGIEKGKAFHPDQKTQDMLKDAVREAHAWLADQYENSYFPPPYYEGGHWCVPVSHDVIEGLQTFFVNPDKYPVDGRGVAYTVGFFSAKHFGAGQFYLMTFTDKTGKGLEGGSTYQLHVPAGAPVRQYWSATVYDRDTHALVRNMQRASQSSQNPQLQKNADGSVDIYFGSHAPAGKESNWVPTSANGKFEILFRLYGPEKALFDKSWKRFANGNYRSDAHWDFALRLDADDPSAFWNLLDERASWFYEAVGAGAAMAPKCPGPSSAYLGAYKDKAGCWLDGGTSYRLRVPPNPPIKLFWSVTVYDVDTRALILNELKIADRSSRMDLRRNEDGSVDIYCAPKAPAGFEKNWIPTVPGRNWFAYFRFYQPTEAYFDRSWPLPDFERISTDAGAQQT